LMSRFSRLHQQQLMAAMQLLFRRKKNFTKRDHQPATVPDRFGKQTSMYVYKVVATGGGCHPAPQSHPTVPVTDYGSCTVDYFGNAVGHVDDIKSERDALNQLEEVQGQLAEAQARAVQLENEKAELQQIVRFLVTHT